MDVEVRDGIFCRLADLELPVMFYEMTTPHVKAA